MEIHIRWWPFGRTRVIRLWEALNGVSWLLLTIYMVVLGVRAGWIGSIYVIQVAFSVMGLLVAIGLIARTWSGEVDRKRK